MRRVLHWCFGLCIVPIQGLLESRAAARHMTGEGGHEGEWKGEGSRGRMHSVESADGKRLVPGLSFTLFGKQIRV